MVFYLDAFGLQDYEGAEFAWESSDPGFPDSGIFELANFYDGEEAGNEHYGSKFPGSQSHYLLHGLEPYPQGADELFTRHHKVLPPGYSPGNPFGGPETELHTVVQGHGHLGPASIAFYERAFDHTALSGGRTLLAETRPADQGIDESHAKSMPAFHGEYPEDFQNRASSEEHFEDEDWADGDYVEEDEGDGDQPYGAAFRTSRSKGLRQGQKVSVKKHTPTLARRRRTIPTRAARPTQAAPLPSKRRFLCSRCGDVWNQCHLWAKDHFKRCIKENGNPDRKEWNSDPSYTDANIAASRKEARERKRRSDKKLGRSRKKR